MNEPIEIEKGVIDSFEEAFDDRVSGCRRTCACGLVFYDTYNTGYDWDAGEIEALQANPQAKGVDHAVGGISFEGSTYVTSCECWKARARRIAAFLTGHDTEIARFLTLERRRREREAGRSPVVEE